MIKEDIIMNKLTMLFFTVTVSAPLQAVSLCYNPDFDVDERHTLQVTAEFTALIKEARTKEQALCQPLTSKEARQAARDFIDQLPVEDTAWIEQ